MLDQRGKIFCREEEKDDLTEDSEKKDDLTEESVFLKCEGLDDLEEDTGGAACRKPGGPTGTSPAPSPFMFNSTEQIPPNQYPTQNQVYPRDIPLVRGINQKSFTPAHTIFPCLLQKFRNAVCRCLDFQKAPQCRQLGGHFVAGTRPNFKKKVGNLHLAANAI